MGPLNRIAITIQLEWLFSHSLSSMRPRSVIGGGLKASQRGQWVPQRASRWGQDHAVTNYIRTPILNLKSCLMDVFAALYSREEFRENLEPRLTLKLNLLFVSMAALTVKYQFWLGEFDLVLNDFFWMVTWILMPNPILRNVSSVWHRSRLS